MEGNGLYDASNPKGKYTTDIVKQQHIDVVTVGNHELYVANTSLREFKQVVPDFKNSYIASNLDFHNPKNGELEPLAPRFRKFTTKNQGIRILAFGFLFNFHGNANNTEVQAVQDTVKEQWFQDAIRSRDVDLFLVAGHVPVRNSQEFDLIYKAIRDVQWDTPIVFFGGHTHIRDFRKFEKKAYGIESGRYMETLGFMSISGISSGNKDDMSATASPEFKRLYIDNNLYSLHHHSGLNESSFPTELGRNVSKLITEDRKTLDLDRTFGCAPQDYWLNRAPYPSKDSLLSWLDKEVIPDTFANASAPSIVLTNSGAMRFDIFKGPFTIDTTFLVSPFTSGFRVLKDVPFSAASQLLQLLNNEGPIAVKQLLALVESDDGQHAMDLEDLRPPLPPANKLSLAAYSDSFRPAGQQQITLGNSDTDQPQIPGYTTKDDAGSDGDDTIHQPIQFYNVPNCVGANIGFGSVDGKAPEKVDLVYNAFIQDWVILGLRYLGVKYEKQDTHAALGGKAFTDVISDWVHEHWKCRD